MRIIAGSKKGKKLFTPEDKNIRPTPDIVRESLFNIIGQDMSGIRFLDLFAGTGAVGLEAVSRGASLCVLVDNSHEAVDLCRRNIHRLLFAERVDVMQMDAGRAVGELAARGRSFDVIFAGPPFGMDTEILEDLAAKIGACGILAEDAVFIIQLPSKVKELKPGKLTLAREKKYGRNKLLLFMMNQSSNLTTITV